MAADRSEISDGLYMTVEQYFALDEATDAKYEYLDGYAYLLRPPSSVYDNPDNQILALAGDSTAHAALSARIAAVLDDALVADNDGCMVYSSDAKVKFAEGRYVYPDATVACGEQNASMLTNPVVVIEVLSPSTEKRDRTAKFKAYKQLPSLQEYILIGSQYKGIDVYRREGVFWKQYSFREGGTVELTSVSVRFPLERIYRGVRLR